MRDPARKPRPATASRPIPALDRLAIALAVTAAVAAPVAAALIPDDDCGDANHANPFARALRELQSRDAIAPGASSVRSAHDCHYAFGAPPVPEVQPTTVITPPPQVLPPPDYAVPAGGAAPPVMPTPPRHQPRTGGVRRPVSPAPAEHPSRILGTTGMVSPEAAPDAAARSTVS